MGDMDDVNVVLFQGGGAQMIRFEHTRVFNLDGAIRGMRNSWESWDKSDSQWVNGQFVLGDADRKLALSLSKAGASHGKYLRQIFVSVDIIAPEYWWKEADTYKVGTVANSTSMMHTLGRRELTADDFSFDDPDNDLVRQYLTLINEARTRWTQSGKKKPSPEWRLMNQLMSIAYLYRRTFTANYQVLKNMYHDRRNHRLSEWHDFCRWVESLPYSELITLKGIE
jgi:hypothetical protein